jgi:hypothetical protein
MLGDSDPVYLNRPIQTFLDELCFIGDRLNDPVAEYWIGRLLQAAQTALSPRGDALLTVEGE